jgi:hypothetical protein
MFGYDFIRSLFLDCLVDINPKAFAGLATVPFTSKQVSYAAIALVNVSGV